jgi:caa(3)-type oxidase subunit IV
MASPKASMNHSLVFSLLVVLVFASVGIHLAHSSGHLSGTLNNLAIFAIAAVMAGLVVLQYMGLKIEGPLVVWLFVIPFILFVVLVFLMMPDVAQVPVDFLRVLLR